MTHHCSNRNFTYILDESGAEAALELPSFLILPKIESSTRHASNGQGMVGTHERDIRVQRLYLMLVYWLARNHQIQTGPFGVIWRKCGTTKGTIRQVALLMV